MTDPAPDRSTGFARLRRRVRRIGTLRVRLTIAVAVLSAAGLTAGGALLVPAVEATVVRAIEDQSPLELHMVRGQIAQGVPLSQVHPLGPGRFVSFLRPDGTRVDASWRDPGDPSLAPPPDPSCLPPPGVAAPGPG